jgi:hypothetical protein
MFHQPSARRDFVGAGRMIGRTDDDQNLCFARGGARGDKRAKEKDQQAGEKDATRHGKRDLFRSVARVGNGCAQDVKIPGASSGP